MASQYEDPQLAELAQLAQVAALLQGPQQQQEQLSQQERIAKMTAAIHMSGLQQQHESDQAQLAELVRYHQESQKGNINDAIVTHTLSDPSIPANIKAATLAKMGHPELADATADAHLQGVQQKAATHLAAINALHQSNPSAVAKYLPAIQADPEVWNLVKGQLPNAAPAPTPSHPFETDAATPGYYPAVANWIGDKLKYAPIDTANLGASIFNNMMVPPANLINSIIGVGPTQRTPYMKRDYADMWSNLLNTQPAQ